MYSVHRWWCSLVGFTQFSFFGFQAAEIYESLEINIVCHMKFLLELARSMAGYKCEIAFHVNIIWCTCWDMNWWHARQSDRHKHSHKYIYYWISNRYNEHAFECIELRTRWRRFIHIEMHQTYLTLILRNTYTRWIAMTANRAGGSSSGIRKTLSKWYAFEWLILISNLNGYLQITYTFVYCVFFPFREINMIKCIFHSKWNALLFGYKSSRFDSLNINIASVA